CGYLHVHLVQCLHRRASLLHLEMLADAAGADGHVGAFCHIILFFGRATIRCCDSGAVSCRTMADHLFAPDESRLSVSGTALSSAILTVAGMPRRSRFCGSSTRIRTS